MVIYYLRRGYVRAMLFAYGYLRVATPDWQTPFKSGSIINVAIMTFVLITSSLTMLGAVDASKAGDKPKALRFLASTMVLGLISRGCTSVNGLACLMKESS